MWRPDLSVTAPVSMDEVDRRLLRVLQADGRITNADLAKQAHLSPAACHERVKRLRERGVITGYAALVDPSAVDLSLLIFVEVVLDRTTGEAFEGFAAAVRRARKYWSAIWWQAASTI
jgi:Lrp/AsnC family leucine-responsive transcriptional regulator